MQIRGVKVDHATIQRWVFKFTPMLDKEFRKRKKRVGMSWRNKTKNGEPINFDQFSALVTSTRKSSNFLEDFVALQKMVSSI